MDTVEGLSEGEAKALIQKSGYDFRVEERDGELLDIDDEHRTDRISLVVEDGEVVSARIG